MISKTTEEIFEPSFCWVVALKAEAQPLISILNLRSISNDLNFPIYTNAETGHALVISGVGNVKSAVAATYLRIVCKVKSFAAWINFGIAGYYSEPVGQIIQAIKVSDLARNKSYFPGVRLTKIIAIAPLYTVSQVEKAYSQPVLYDMEAAGFCEIVPSFCCNELIFVLKVVSDTPKTSAETVSKKQIKKLILQNTEKIYELISEISHIVDSEKARLSIPEEVFNCLEIHHFSATNRHRLLQVYRKWKTAFPERSLIDSSRSISSAKGLIYCLESELKIAAKDWKLN